MTAASLIAHRWVKVNGVPLESELPTNSLIQSFAFSEFGVVCGEAVAGRVFISLRALAKEWKGNDESAF